MPLLLILPSMPPVPEQVEVALVTVAQGQQSSQAERSTLDSLGRETSAPRVEPIIPLRLAQSPPSSEGDPSRQQGQDSSSDPQTAPDSTELDPSSESETAPDSTELNPRSGPETAPDSTELEPGFNGETTLLLQADRQMFEPVRQIVTATGDVLVQFGTGQLTADRLWVNLTNRYLRAEGNVFFNRNNQIIEGESATYNLLQGSGDITAGRGELQISTLADDFSTAFPGGTQGVGTPLDFRQRNQGSISGVTSPGRLAVATGDTQPLLQGRAEGLQRLRFESRRLSFDADSWYVEDLRLTNDPFSPPDLEFRATSARLTPINDEEDELIVDGGRLVFNQGLTIPVVRRRYVLQRGQLPPDAFNPLPTGIGIDGRDRDGLYIEREFPVASAGGWNLAVAPQFLVSRWLGDSNYNIADPANFGLAARFSGPLGLRTFATGTANLAGLDLANIGDRLRASVRGQHLLGNHRLNLEYSYRDRLFNGSLGFQDVQSSLGLLLQSPNITLGATGLNLTYQLSGQYVTANTDRATLLSPGEASGLTSLFRFQGSVDLGRGFVLWRGQPLPATPTEGLRYSDRPLMPYLGLQVGVRGTATYYTSDDLQESVEGRIALVGQLGRLQRNTFDYTQFNIGFSRSLIGGDTSPFLFDRSVDQSVLSGGVVQQIYGPFLAGFQTSINVDTGRTIDTNLIFEYRRRAYGVLVTYSPTQETGFLGFRISGFDWVGRTAPFDADPTTPSEVQVQ